MNQISILLTHWHGPDHTVALALFTAVITLLTSLVNLRYFIVGPILHWNELKLTVSEPGRKDSEKALKGDGRWEFE